ncbi:MAG: class I SAM-dependent methyltransferase [Desulfobulbaceae bacterium]|nr:class I SAM-dependent methyltransferase [Desulfobulbaceae bacterium]
MSGHVCPWWLTYTFDNPLRSLFHNPAEILAPYVIPGMTVADLGCGFGYFSIGLARIVGPDGRVIAVDIQQKMLEKAKQRALNVGLDAIIEFHKCSPDSLNMSKVTDFALAFWMVHETGDPVRFLRQVYIALRPEGTFLMVEPILHVSEKSFGAQTRLAEEVGFIPIGFPRIRLSRAVAFRKKP